MAFNIVDKAVYQLDVAGLASTQTVLNVYHYSASIAVPGQDYTSQDFLGQWKLLVGDPFLAFIADNYQGALLRIRQVVQVNLIPGDPNVNVPVYGVEDELQEWRSVAGTRTFPYLPTYVAATIKLRGERQGIFLNGSKRIGPLAEAQTEGGGTPNELEVAEHVLLIQLGATIESKIPSTIEASNIMTSGILSLTRAGIGGLPVDDHFFATQSTIGFKVIGSQVSRKRLRNATSQ